MTHLLLLLLLITLTTANTPPSCPRTISIDGEASVPSAPDIATVTTAVITLAPTAQAALSQNNRLTAALFETLSEFDIASRDIQTTGFNVNPRFERRQNGDTRRIIGYTVRNSLRVIVRDLSNLGAILDALVRAGSNSVSGVRFGLSEDVELRDEARTLAVRDAVRKATVLAQAAGVRLGKVLSIREGGGGFIGDIATSFQADAVSEVPVALGELQIGARVTLEIELVGGARGAE